MDSEIIVSYPSAILTNVFYKMRAEPEYSKEETLIQHLGLAAHGPKPEPFALIWTYEIKDKHKFCLAKLKYDF